MAPFPSGTFVLDVELVSEADVKLIVTITVPGDKPQEMAAVPLRFLRTGADPSEKGELKLVEEQKKKGAVAGDSKGDKKGAVAGAAKKAGGSAVVGAEKKSVQIDVPTTAGAAASMGSDAGEGGGKGHLGGARLDTPMARSLAAKADLADRELNARSETVAAAKLERQQAMEEEAARKAAQAQAAQAQASAEMAAAARAERAAAAEAKVADLASRSNLSAEMKAELSALREAAAAERAHADLAMAEAAAAAKAARELAGAAAREEEVREGGSGRMTSDDLG